MEPTTQLLLQAKKGDKKARDTLVEENLGLVHFIVRRFLNRGYEAEDLFQIGCIGLVKAVDQFDVEYGVKFSTYAVPLITGEIKRFLRDDGMIKVSRSLKEKNGRIRQAAGEFAAREGREPTLKELEAATGFEKEEIAMALEANVEIESIYRTVYQSDGSEIYLVDKVVKETETGTGVMYMDADDKEKDKVLDIILLKHLMEQLDSMEKEIIRLRFFEDKTQTQVAKLLDMSQVQICRQEKKILLKLRALALKER
ncbi:MAG: SigB/SigF/SigG family RNA polymerase sigma factor [Lachnospiraceae bacterium]|nr:SigB/SigF/SigG family RNA polymerase sigma factor [Lachnospiraceae bacterium]